MKRTYDWIEVDENSANKMPKLIAKITCEVTGEMENGTKVWTRIGEDGKLMLDEQFYSGRLCGYNFFSKW